MASSFHNGDVEIAYFDEGEGEPIVLVHGFASNKEFNWVNPSWVATLTRAGRRVIALDNRGHGQSSKLYDPAAYEMALMAGDVRALLDHLRIERADVMGYSMGARIAGLPRRASCRSACARPSSAGSASAWWRATVRPGRAHRRGAAKRRRSPTSPIRTGRAFRRFAEQTKSGPARRSPPACAGRARCSRREQVAGIAVPVLVAVGTKDDVSGSGPELAALIPGARNARYSRPRPHAGGRRQGIQSRRARFS